MKRCENTHIVEIAVLYLLDPTQRVLHAGKIVLRRISKQTVGVIVVDHTEHILLIVLACASAGLIMRQVFLVQDAEPTAKTVGILANTENRVMVLYLTTIHRNVPPQDSRSENACSTERSRPQCATLPLLHW